MANEKCPNCGQFKFQEGLSSGCTGCLLIVGGLVFPGIAAGAAGFYGGVVTGLGLLMLPVIIYGIFKLIKSFVKPDQTIKYKCSNCQFEQEYLKN
jgi:hypothetical protein